MSLLDNHRGAVKDQYKKTVLYNIIPSNFLSRSRTVALGSLLVQSIKSRIPLFTLLARKFSGGIQVGYLHEGGTQTLALKISGTVEN